MADLALLQSQLGALLAARACAERTVRFRASTGEEREVTYRTAAELWSTLALPQLRSSRAQEAMQTSTLLLTGQPRIAAACLAVTCG